PRSEKPSPDLADRLPPSSSPSVPPASVRPIRSWCWTTERSAGWELMILLSVPAPPTVRSTSPSSRRNGTVTRTEKRFPAGRTEPLLSAERRFFHENRYSAAEEQQHGNPVEGTPLHREVPFPSDPQHCSRLGFCDPSALRSHPFRRRHR